MQFEPGNLIARPDDLLAQVEIVEIRVAGYGWRYAPPPGVAGTGEMYGSEPTDDPFFDVGWVRVRAKTPVVALPSFERQLPPRAR
jgi:hypothetical protein